MAIRKPLSLAPVRAKASTTQTAEAEQDRFKHVLSQMKAGTFRDPLEGGFKARPETLGEKARAVGGYGKEILRSNILGTLEAVKTIPSLPAALVGGEEGIQGAIPTEGIGMAASIGRPISEFLEETKLDTVFDLLFGKNSPGITGQTIRAGMGQLEASLPKLDDYYQDAQLAKADILSITQDMPGVKALPQSLQSIVMGTAAMAVEAPFWLSPGKTITKPVLGLLRTVGATALITRIGIKQVKKAKGLKTLGRVASVNSTTEQNVRQMLLTPIDTIKIADARAMATASDAAVAGTKYKKALTDLPQGDPSRQILPGQADQLPIGFPGAPRGPLQGDLGLVEGVARGRELAALREAAETSKSLASEASAEARMLHGLKDTLDDIESVLEDSFSISEKITRKGFTPWDRQGIREVRKRLERGTLEVAPDINASPLLAARDEKGIAGFLFDIGHLWDGDKSYAAFMGRMHELGVRKALQYPIIKTLSTAGPVKATKLAFEGAPAIRKTRAAITNWGSKHYPGIKKVDLADNYDEDLLFYSLSTFADSGRGNPKVAGDTVESLTRRVKSHPLFEQNNEIMQDFHALSDGLIKELKELDFTLGTRGAKDSQISNLRAHFLSTMWDPVEAADVDRTFLQRWAKIGPKTQPPEVEDFFRNFLSGIEQGKTPGSVKMSQIYHSVMVRAGNIGAAKRTIKKSLNYNMGDNGLPIFLTSRDALYLKNTKDYKVIESELLRKQMPGAGEKLFIHKDAVDPLKNILADRFVSKKGGGPVSAFASMMGTAKSMHYILSPFHPITLVESTAGSRGPGLGGMRAAYQTRFGLPLSWSRDPKLMASPQVVGPLISSISESKTEWKQIAFRWHRAGLGIGAPETDYLYRNMDLLFKGLEERVDTNFFGFLPKNFRPAKMSHWLQKNAEVALWGRQHLPIKLGTAEFVGNALREVKQGVRPKGWWSHPGMMKLEKNLDDLTDIEIDRKVAAYLNDEFGSQKMALSTNAFLRSISSPEAEQGLRIFFESADWNISAARQAWAFLQTSKMMNFNIPRKMLKGMGADTAASYVPNLYDPVRGFMGLRHIRNQLFSLFMYGNATNKALSGHYMWENEPGKWGSVDLGIQDPDTGRRIYMRLSKSLHDAVPIILAGAEASDFHIWPGGRGGLQLEGKDHLASKVSATLKGFIFPNSYEYEQIIAEHMREGRYLDGKELALMKTKEFMGGFRPFSMGKKMGSGTFAENPGRWLGFRMIPYPLTFGTNLSLARTRMTEAYRKGDPDYQNEIERALHLNGYDWPRIESLRRSAFKKAQLDP